MRVLFAGTGDIGIPSLRFLRAEHELVGVLTQPDRPAGRHRQLKAPAIKEEVLTAFPEIPILQPESPRDPGVLPWVRGLAPEVIVTMAYGRILPRELLEAPTVACLNIHASLLPRHRGASPIQACLLAGDRETGVTIMHMAEGLDTGDTILSRAIAVRRRETSGTLSERLATLAPVALGEALSLLASGKAPRSPQDHAAATLCGKIDRPMTLLDWSLGARELERRIRAFQPRPGAVVSLPLASGGVVSLKVHSAIVLSKATGIPGAVLRADEGGVVVACGEGALLLGTVQPEGGGRMPSAAFARGRPLSLV